METYPTVPNPTTVEIRLDRVTSPEINPRAVEKEEISAVTKDVDAYPAVPSPTTVEIRFARFTSPDI